jgi:hypothetical protein
MNKIEAINTVEGCVEPRGNTPEEQDAHYLECWQYLIDTGICWKLQGWYERAAKQLIESELCTWPIISPSKCKKREK